MCYPNSSFYNEGVVDVVELHIHCMLFQLVSDNKELLHRLNNNAIGYCVVCGKAIENANLQRKTRDFLWCSRKCYSEKPRKIIALERRNGKSIQEILIETTKKYQNINSQQNALHVSTPYLYQIIRKYFGSDYLSFFAEHAIGKRQEVYARKIRQRKICTIPQA